MTDYLIYGVDGMSKPVVEMMAAENDLPNIQKLRQKEKTVDGEWESYVSPESRINVPRTGPMWNSIYTGLKPKEHGYTLDGWNEGESKFHQSFTVWDKLGEEGIEMALWDMPMTYRAKEINGWMMSGFVATTLKSMFENMIYPSDLIKDNDFIEETPTYIAKVTFDGIAPNINQETGEREPMDNSEEWYEKTKKSEKKKIEKFKEKIEEKGKPDVVAYGTTFADKIGHAAGINPTNELTRKTYKQVDHNLGELIETLEPEEVIIISDHGFSGWSHSLQGYFLNTEGEILENVFDFTPYILKKYGLEYNPERYGIDGKLGDDLTEREKEDIKGQLEGLGYDTS